MPTPGVKIETALYDNGRSALNQSGFAGLEAFFKRLVGINDGFCQPNLFESRFDLKIQMEISIGGDVLTVARQPLPGVLLAASAFENSPRLTNRLSVAGRALNLIRPRECTAIQEYMALRIFPEDVTGNFEHDCHAEIILFG